MKFTKKIVAILLVAVMALSMAVTSFAASSDPNLTAYNTDYTQFVNSGTARVLTMSVTTADQYWSVTGFDTEEDAEAVQWSVVSGSISGITVVGGGAYATSMGNGKYASSVRIRVSDSAAIGAASIEARVPGTNATMNFTVVVNGFDSERTNISYKFYNGNTELLTVNNMSVSGTGYYGNTGYTSALDGLFASWIATYGNDTSLRNYMVTNYGTCYVEGLSFTVDGEQIELTESYDDNWDYYGWQYRVYHNGQIVPLSEFIGADECQISDGDTVVWKYGKFGDVAFTQTI